MFQLEDFTKIKREDTSRRFQYLKIGDLAKIWGMHHHDITIKWYIPMDPGTFSESIWSLWAMIFGGLSTFSENMLIRRDCNDFSILSPFHTDYCMMFPWASHSIFILSLLFPSIFPYVPWASHHRKLFFKGAFQDLAQPTIGREMCSSWDLARWRMAVPQKNRGS